MPGTLDLSGIQDLAGKKESELTPEEIDRLMSNPMVRQLQYQIQHGVQDIKLESGQGEHKMKNVVVPEGADPQEVLQRMMAEEHKNKEREKKQKAARDEKLRQERLEKSDPLQYIVSGAGSPEVDGLYIRDGDAIRNGSRVYKMTKDGVNPVPNGFMMSHECVAGSEGFILGKAPRAWYAFQTKDRVCPEEGWVAQEHGKEPAPTFKAVEPLHVVEKEKAEGNALFAKGEHQAAVSQYTKAIELANACIKAHGMTDDLFGKLYGNRAEAYLQLGEYEKCIEDADASLEYDPCFVKGFVRKAKAAYNLKQYDVASQCLKDALDVVPGNKEILALQDEYRVAGIARSGEDQTLTELAGLCSRLNALVKRKGTASEVLAILKQLPTLLQALKLKQDETSGAMGGRQYESAPNYNAQVYFRLQTNGFALLAPIIRPAPKNPELLRECLETMAAALRDCATNQVAFDKFVPQLVPLLRAKDSLPYEILKAAVKVLGTMASRVAARKIMYDPDSAEGIMYVLAHPDSSQARPATFIIQAIDALHDMNTLAILLSVPNACEIFWRESHSRREDIRTPARSILARAFGHTLCRRRLKCLEKVKRLVNLWDSLAESAPEAERYDLSENPEDDDGDQLVVRDFMELEKEPLRVLTALITGTAHECEGSPELVETLHRMRAYDMVVPMCCARPPLSTGALKLLRVSMGHNQNVVDRVVQLGLPAWLLQCREESEYSDDFNANMRTTLMSQAARDDSCMILGHAADQGVFHSCIDLFDNGVVMRRMCEVLNGQPSDDATVAGCRCVKYLLSYKTGVRRSSLRAEDVHDVLIPLWLHKEDAAKDAAGQALRRVLSDQIWMNKALKYFEERGSVNKLSQVIQEMNSFEEVKEMRTTGKKRDQLRPNNAPLESTLETEHRRENLNTYKVVEYLLKEVPSTGVVVDVGAGTGIFTIPFAQALPQGHVYACEVRSDALRTLNSRVTKLQLANLTVMRMAKTTMHLLPDQRKADLIFLCDVFAFIGEDIREHFLHSLRSLLTPGGRLVVIENRELSDNYLIDIQDADFLQQRCAQIVSNRRMMLFKVDPAAKPGPALPVAPPLREEDLKEPDAPLLDETPPIESKVAITALGEADNEIKSKEVDDDDDDECIVEENLIPPSRSAPVPPRATVQTVDGEDSDCLLEENGTAQNSAFSADNLDDDDDDACLLEENGATAAEAQEDDLEEGCLLEDNDQASNAGAANDTDCLLEENVVPHNVLRARTADDDDDDDDGCLLEEN